MSLFGDLPALGSAHHESAGPVTSILKKPAAAPVAPPPSILRNKRKAEESSGTPAAITGSDGHGLFAPFGPIEDEYDPAVPNEYQKAKQAQEEAVLEADRAARQAAQEREWGTQPEAAEAANDSGDGFEPRGGLGSSGAAQGGAGLGAEKGAGGLSVAEKLMKGMGWSEGEGLGKEKQGISTPFILQKTDTRTGVIVNAQPLQAPSTQGAAQNEGTPTKIVLLKNMVGPGDVDDGLEDEVAEEVSKFGEVFRVLIFEVSGVPVAPHQAVRIFVEMDKIQSAQQAVGALNGRYFDQKIISASFFDESRFEAMDLAPRPDELN